MEQTRKTRAELVLHYLRGGAENAVTRNTLAALTGLSDRAVRKAIQDLRDRDLLIVNDQSGHGYYLATSGDLEALQRQYRQDTARALSILKRRKATRRILKAAGRSV